MLGPTDAARIDGRRAAEDEGRRHGALFSQSIDIGREQCRMRAIGCDEINERLRVLDMLHEVSPARIWLDPGVGRLVVEIAPRRVQGRNAGIATACEIEHGQIERQAHEVVAQRLGDELVDLVAGLAGEAAHDGA